MVNGAFGPVHDSEVEPCGAQSSNASIHPRLGRDGSYKAKKYEMPLTPKYDDGKANVKLGVVENVTVVLDVEKTARPS